MKTKQVKFFEEQIEDAKILMKQLGFRDFSSFMRFCLQEKIRANAKTIEKYRQKQQAT